MSKREEFIDKTDRRKIPKLSYSIEYICDRIVDWYYHVETTKIAKLSIHDNKINYMYEPFPYRKLIHLFKCYPFEENDGFIDIGCGKGRVLVEASLHGCCNIYGVDLSEELLVYARKNMRECLRVLIGDRIDELSDHQSTLICSPGFRGMCMVALRFSFSFWI